MDMIPGLKLSSMSDRKSHVCTEEEKSRRINCFSKRGVSFFFSLLCCCSPIPRKALGHNRWLWASSRSPVHTLCSPVLGACFLQQVASWVPGGKGQKRTSPGPQLSGALLRSLPKGLVQQLALTSSWTEHSHMGT